LAHHYVAYRAHVRAKVAAITFGQIDSAVSGGDVHADDFEARSSAQRRDAAIADVLTYHRLALQHLEVGRPRLILVGGGAGVGKSTVAGGIADRLSIAWLRSDELRKELAGIDYDRHAYSEPDSGIYSPEFTDVVYQEMLARADALLRRGESVIIDASWSREGHRAQARSLGQALKAQVVELHCSLPPAVARERIAKRMASMYNPSDATPEIADHLAARFDPWADAVTVNTNQEIAETVDDAYRHVMTDPAEDNCGTPSLRVDETSLTTETIAFFLSRSRVTTARWVSET